MGDIEVDAGTGIVFVLLPGGSFTMGSQRSQPDAPGYDPEGSEDSGPPHQVHLAPFFLARHEATQGQWRRLTGQTPSHYPAAANVAGRSITWSHPVEQVDWHDCARWLTQHGLALPTEAQWEYGCRAGTTTPWWTGADRETLRGVANLADQSAGRAGAPWADIADWPDLDDGFAVHAPVDALRPNAFGMHHVHGNVWEWCRDVRVAYSVPARPGDGARGVEPGPLRVVRGGGFINAARGARSGDRGDGTATMRMNALGVRPARELIGPQQTSSSR